jgi:D-sedoheptulose 7-phosphate isomerase
MKGFKAVGELAEVLGSLGKAGSGNLEKTVETIIRAVRAGHKVLVFGNGGSAAEAQHFAAELVNRFLTERRAIPAIALTTDTAALTAIANDRSFEMIFSRQIEAFGDKGDVAIALTTSGRSQNIIEGLKAAKAKGMATIALTGEGGGAVAGLPDILLYVPSKSTPRIQEAHLVLLHIIAEAVEAAASSPRS